MRNKSGRLVAVAVAVLTAFGVSVQPAYADSGWQPIKGYNDAWYGCNQYGCDWVWWSPGEISRDVLLLMKQGRAVTMYRLYNPNSGEHFYTSNTVEVEKLSGPMGSGGGFCGVDSDGQFKCWGINRGAGWKLEQNAGWIAPTQGAPVYRLYNRNAGDHHYTLNAAERDMLIKKGWKYEGIGWHSGGSWPLYRQYNRRARRGTHNYTVSKPENDMLVRLGWKAEGIGWHALSPDFADKYAHGIG